MNELLLIHRNTIKSAIRTSLELMRSPDDYEEFAEFLTESAARLNKAAGQLEELKRQKQRIGMNTKD